MPSMSGVSSHSGRGQHGPGLPGHSCPHCRVPFLLRDHAPENSRAPFLLNCGHSECDSCIRQKCKGKKKVACSVCQAATPLPAGAAGSREIPLPQNMHLLGSLRAKRNAMHHNKLTFHPAVSQKQGKADQGSNGLPPVKLCIECTQDIAALHCLGCHSPYCKPCYSRVHDQSKVMSRHTFRPIGAEDKTDSYENFIVGNCPDHETEPLRYFCEECQDLACARCVCTTHKKHEMKSLEEKNEVYLPEIDKTMEDGSRIYKRICKAEMEVKKQRALKMPEFQEIEQEAEHHFSYLHGLLQVQENAVKDKIREKVAEYNDHWDALATELLEHKNSLLSLMKVARKVKKQRLNATLNAKEIHDQLKKIQHLPCCLVAEGDDIEQEARANLVIGKDIENTIKNCANVEATFQLRYALVQEDEVPENYDLDLKDCNFSLDGFCSDATDGASSRRSHTSSVSLTLDEESTQVFVVDAVDKERSITRDQRALICGNEQVIVTHITSPSQFYVQNTNHQQEIMKMNEALNQLGRGKEHRGDVPEDIDIGSMYLVQYGNDGNWYRGRVMNTLEASGGDEAYEVFYIDYGNTEAVTHNRFRNLPKKFTKIVPKCSECCLLELAPVKNDTWAEESINRFVELVKKVRLLMIVIEKKDAVLNVDLLRMPDHGIKGDYLVSVRDSMIFLEVAKYINACKIQKPLGFGEEQKYLVHEDMNKGKQLDIIPAFVESPGSFYVHKMSTAKYHLKMQEEMQVFYNRSDSFQKWAVYAPKKGMVCACLYSEDKTWYRAEVVSLPGKARAEVVYVDYGNKEIVSWECLRKLNSEFLKHVKQAIHCSLVDVSPLENEYSWSKTATDQFASILKQGRQLTMRVENTEETGLLDVVLYQRGPGDRLYATNAMLVKAKLVEATGPNAMCVELSKLDMTNYGKKNMLDLLRGSVAEGDSTEQTTPSHMTAIEISQSLRGPIPQPTEVSAAAALPELLTPSMQAGEVEVKVTHFESPGCLYVQKVEDQLALDNLSSLMNKHYQNSRKQPLHPEHNDLLAALIGDDWLRVRVTDPDHKEDSVLATMIDTGITIPVPRSKLRSVPRAFLEIPLFATRCHLAGIIPAGGKEWGVSSREELARIMMGHDVFYMAKMGEMVGGGDQVKDAGDWGMSLPVTLKYGELLDQGALMPRKAVTMSLTQLLLDAGVALPERIKARQQNMKGPKSEEPEKEKVKTTAEESPSTSDNASYATAESGACSLKVLEPVDLANWKPLKESSPKKLHKPASHKPVFRSWLKPDPPIKREFRAVVTYVDKNGHIFVQDVKMRETVVSEMTDILQSALKGSQTKKPVEILPVGTPCTAMYHHDEKWYRALILQHNPHDVMDVKFADYGNEEVINARDIRKEVFETDVPELCWECELVGIVPNQTSGIWPTKVLEHIHELIVDKEVKVIVHETPKNKPVRISLVRESGWNLATMLISQSFAKKTAEMNSLYQSDERENVISPPLAQEEVYLDYTAISIPETERKFSVMVTHVQSSCEIYFVVMSKGRTASEFMTQIGTHTQDFGEMTKRLQKEAPLMPVMETPEPDLFCCAIFEDELWYRAFIMGVESRDERRVVFVKYVDFGNTAYVPAESVKIMPNYYLRLPSMAIHARLSGLGLKVEPEATEVMKGLTAALTPAVLTATVIESDPMTVELYDADGKLAYEDFIVAEEMPPE